MSRTPAVGTCTYWFTDRFQREKNQGAGDGRGSLNDLHMAVEGGTELVLCDASRLGGVPRLTTSQRRFLQTRICSTAAEWSVGGRVRNVKHGPTFNRDISLANTASGISADGKARKFTSLV